MTDQGNSGFKDFLPPYCSPVDDVQPAGVQVAAPAGVQAPPPPSCPIDDPSLIRCLVALACKYWRIIKPFLDTFFNFICSNTGTIDLLIRTSVLGMVVMLIYFVCRYIQRRERQEKFLLNWIYGCVALCIATAIAVMVMTCQVFSFTAFRQARSKLVCTYSYIFIGLSTLMILYRTLQKCVCLPCPDPPAPQPDPCCLPSPPPACPDGCAQIPPLPTPIQAIPTNSGVTNQAPPTNGTGQGCFRDAAGQVQCAPTINMS